MKLLHCHIVNFGCLSDVTFRFDEGLNLLYAANGQGKSTFAVFLKAMLYGLPPINKRALQESERRRYMPWQGGSFGGSLCFEAEGEGYRLERFFGEKEKEDRFALYHLATGNLSDRYTENVGVELFGVDAEGFERSLYISQRLPFAPPDNNSIRTRLGTLLDASDDLGNFERADKLLDDARRFYSVQGGRGLIAELADDAREKANEIAAAKTAEERATVLRAECAALEAKKVELTEQLEAVKVKRTEAEKRRRWEEQSAHYRSLCEARDAEKTALAPLEEFFAPHFPTDEELLSADTAVSELNTLAVQIDGAALSEEEKTSLSSLSLRYGVQGGSGAFLEKLRASHAHWHKKKDALAALLAKKEAKEEAAASRLCARYPTEAELLAIRAAKEATEEAQAALYAGTPKTGKALPIFSCTSAVLFAVLGVLGVALSIVPLAVCGFALCAGALVLLLFALFKTRTQKSRLPDEYHVQADRLLYLLSPFGYTDKNALLAASRFLDDLTRYESVKGELAALSEDVAALAAEEAQGRAVLFALLPEGTEDPDAALQKIEADLSLYAHLTQKDAACAAQKKRLCAEQERLSTQLSLFLSHFPALAALTPRAALDQIKQNVLLCRQRLQSYNGARGRVDEFLSTTHFDPEASPPPYLGEIHLILEEERQTEAALRETEAALSVKKSDGARQEEIAATIPTLLAQREALERDKENAEHTLSLILLTKSTLKEAKDDLATRYLRDMEMHFDRYYQKLTESADAELPSDGSRISSFSMDVSLALSVERYGERRPVSALSRGESDLAAFCARLSLMEAIFTAETPFLLLDDPFINLDDGNYAKACALLATLAERFQIIYTVCSEARLPASIPLKTLS